MSDSRFFHTRRAPTPGTGTDRRGRALPVATLLAGSLALAACGSSTVTTSPATTTAPASQKAAGTSPTPAAVATVESAVTAQMVSAASHASSSAHEATFTLTATTSAGKPAAGEPVSFWVGPMTPLSGVHPAHWYRSGSSAAGAYVASASSTTDAAGQARIVLLGQPTKSMEMVAVKIGGLDSFDTAAAKGLGLMDAWWTTPATMPTAPVGDTVEVSPFLTATKPGQRTVFHVRVADSAGRPISGASVQFIPQKPTSTMSGASGMSGSSAMSTTTTAASSGMSGMSGGSAMSGMSMKTVKTDSAGVATYSFQRPTKATACPVRVVVTQPSSSGRIAGGMAGELITSP